MENPVKKQKPQKVNNKNLTNQKHQHFLLNQSIVIFLKMFIEGDFLQRF